MRNWKKILFTSLIAGALVSGSSICSYAQDTYTFEYTGKVQEWVVPSTGLYKLEAWGASGGGGHFGTAKGAPVPLPGLGGYHCGTVSLVKDQKLYIVVGGSGMAKSSSSCVDGRITYHYSPWVEYPEWMRLDHAGFNGGGDGMLAGGGGATHIATALPNGIKKKEAPLLSSYCPATEKYACTDGIYHPYWSYEDRGRDKILLVAGGGGGSVNANVEWGAKSGDGGGNKGGDGTAELNGGGGSQQEPSMAKYADIQTWTHPTTYRKESVKSARDAYDGLYCMGRFGAGGEILCQNYRVPTHTGGGAGWFGGQAGKRYHGAEAGRYSSAGGSGHAHSSLRNVSSKNGVRQGDGLVKISAASVQLTFDGNGGSSAASISAMPGETIHPGSSSRTGYTFLGWYTARSGGTKLGTTMPAEGGTYYAHWSTNSYSISYNLGGGNFGSKHPTTASYDTAFTVDLPSRTGYTFAGWTITGMDGVTHTYGSTTTTATSLSGRKETSYKNLLASGGTVTFTANWNANTYTVKYSDGGSGTTTQTMTYDTAANLKPANTFRKAFTVTYNGNGGRADRSQDIAECPFLTWSTKTSTSANGAVNYAAGQSVKNLTTTNGDTIQLYAIWGKGSVTLPSAVRNYYDFGGWNLGDTFVGSSGKTFSPEKDETLSAIWTPHEYTIRINTRSETNPNRVLTYNVSSSAIIIPNLAESKREFVGWIGSNGATPQKDLVIPTGSFGYRYYDAVWASQPDSKLRGNTNVTHNRLGIKDHKPDLKIYN